MKHWYKNYT